MIQQLCSLVFTPKNKKMYFHMEICTWMFRAALFIIAQTWKQFLFIPSLTLFLSLVDLTSLTYILCFSSEELLLIFLAGQILWQQFSLHFSELVVWSFLCFLMNIHFYFMFWFSLWVFFYVRVSTPLPAYVCTHIVEDYIL